MARRVKIAGLALALLMATAPAMAQTLADSFAAAYRNSNLLEQNRALLRAADEDVAQAVASLRPVLNFVTEAQARFQSGGAQSVSLSFNLAAEVTLIDFGRGQLAKEAAKAQVLATRHALVEIEQQVLLNTVQAFMNVRTASETVGLRRANVRVITQELDAARQRFELSEITRTDVSLAEARLAAARSALAAAEGELAAAREGFKLATGIAAGNLPPPPALPRTAASLTAAQEIARQAHPRILQTRQEVTAAELNAERVFAQRHGAVTGSASVGQQFGGQFGGETTTATAGVRFARPIYQGGALNSLHRQANARRDAVRAGLHQSVAQVLQNVAVAWANVDVARARITASQQQVRASQSAFEGVREEARLGARTTLDVLNAETDLLDARTLLAQAQASEQVAAYNLLAAMGLLTVDHLGLGIPTYDPEAYFNAVRNAPIASPQGEALDRVLRALGRE